MDQGERDPQTSLAPRRTSHVPVLIEKPLLQLLDVVALLLLTLRCRLLLLYQPMDPAKRTHQMVL